MENAADGALLHGERLRRARGTAEGEREDAADQPPEVDLGYHGPFSHPRSVPPIFARPCISCHGLGKAPSFIGTNGILWLVKPEDRAAFLALVRGSLVNSKWHDSDGTCGRPVEDGCECNSCWVRRGGFNRAPDR